MKRFVVLMIVCISLAACAPAPEPTPTPNPPTSTPLPTFTPLPSPTATEIPTPTSSVSGGYQVIEGNGVSITVPDTYIGGSDEDIQLVLETMKEMGGAFSDAAQLVEDNPGFYLIFAYDTSLGPSGSLTNFNVTTTQLPSELTLKSQLPSLIDYYEQIGGTDIESQTCTHEDQDCFEVYVTIMAEGTTMRMLQYLVREGVDVYAVTFGTDILEFPDRYAEFSQAFTTFQILN
ncbi:MAG: hypothetical protein C4545_00400 [Anaerolineaceae bacterium]|jgi:hypothetical protein|nr:MAG: hypothetical protein C4545_00400 [Anaerolineaceae bacterium]